MSRDDVTPLSSAVGSECESRQDISCESTAAGLQTCQRHTADCYRYSVVTHTHTQLICLFIRLPISPHTTDTDNAPHTTRVPNGITSQSSCPPNSTPYLPSSTPYGVIRPSYYPEGTTGRHSGSATKSDPINPSHFLTDSYSTIQSSEFRASN